MFPIIATQFGVNRTIEKVLESGRSDPLSNSQKIGMAMVAGSTSSVFGCPAEYLMIHQQRTGKSLIGAFKSNTSLYGYSTIYRGLVRVIVCFDVDCEQSAWEKPGNIIILLHAGCYRI